MPPAEPIPTNHPDLLRTTLHLPKHVVAATHGAETVLLDVRRGQFFSCNEVGGRIWELLGDGLPGERIVDVLANEYVVSRLLLTEDLERFLCLLLARELVNQ